MDYPNNSEMAKKNEKELEPQKKFTAPSSVSESLNKESIVQSVFKDFFAEDLHTVAHTVLKDVIRPWLLNGIFEMIVNGARTWIFGANGTPTSNSITAPQSSYIDYTQPAKLTDGKTQSQNTKTKIFNPSSQSFSNRGAAELVLSNMKNAIKLYDSVNVGDFCDLCGIDCDFTCYNYGWTNLDSAAVIPDRNGYHIQFPPAKPIERK